MRSSSAILLPTILISIVEGFLSPPFSRQTSTKSFNEEYLSRHFNSADSTNDGIDPNTLMDMDIVVFSSRSDTAASVLQLGAIQEDGTLAPLSAWTEEFAFGEAIEFLVDEEDRWMKELEFDNIIIHRVLGQDLMSYGSRQVGGGKGPGNPHGEESEQLYYIEKKVMTDNSISVVMKPELEIQW
jgi:hypothetical protein